MFICHVSNMQLFLFLHSLVSRDHNKSRFSFLLFYYLFLFLCFELFISTELVPVPCVSEMFLNTSKLQIYLDFIFLFFFIC